MNGLFISRLKGMWNLHQVPSGKKGYNFPDLHQVIMGFKVCLLEVDHRVDNLQVEYDKCESII